MGVQVTHETPPPCRHHPLGTTLHEAAADTCGFVHTVFSGWLANACSGSRRSSSAQLWKADRPYSASLADGGVSHAAGNGGLGFLRTPPHQEQKHPCCSAPRLPTEMCPGMSWRGDGPSNDAHNRGEGGEPLTLAPAECLPGLRGRTGQGGWKWHFPTLKAKGRVFVSSQTSATEQFVSLQTFVNIRVSWFVSRTRKRNKLAFSGWGPSLSPAPPQNCLL